jgi:hypothetical protein
MASKIKQYLLESIFINFLILFDFTYLLAVASEKRERQDKNVNIIN